jgi:hypothetical protein
LPLTTDRTVSGLSEQETMLPLNNEKTVSGLGLNWIAPALSHERTLSGLRKDRTPYPIMSQRTESELPVHEVSQLPVHEVSQLPVHEVSQLSSGSCSPQLLLPTTVLEAEHLGPASPNGSDITTGDNDFLNSSLTPMDWLPR